MAKRFEVNLTPEEEQICLAAKRTGNFDIFTRHFFRLPKSGSRWMPLDDDCIGHYRNLFTPSQVYDAWQRAGKPDTELTVHANGFPYTLTIDWNRDKPEFLLPHGFIFFDWIRPIISIDTDIAYAETGTGSGKTSNVAIAAMTYCALFPGFSFMNIAPFEKQAQLILAELDKWAGGADVPFRRFIKPTLRDGLYIKKPYAIAEIVSPFDPNYPSTFACQTIGTDANAITGTNQDWTNIDEAQFTANVHEVIPKVVTRSRATRANGDLRLTKLTIITNPGADANLDIAKEKVKSIAAAKTFEGVPVRAYYVDGVRSNVNLYNTKKQLAYQGAMMDAQDRARWMAGEASALDETNEIPARLITDNVDPVMDDEIRVQALHKAVKRDDLGLCYYEMPREEDHIYIATGDPGKSPARMTYNNVPIVTVWDVTNFLVEPARLVYYHMADGDKTYHPWFNSFKYAMLKYRAVGYYDATNLGLTGFEDAGVFLNDLNISHNGMELKAPAQFVTTPITLAVNNKRWARTMMIMLAQDGQFAWPRIEALVHQAKSYRESGEGVKKIPDDIIASIFVYCMALRIDNALWSRVVKRYYWDEVEKEEQRRNNPVEHERPYEYDRTQLREGREWRTER